MVGRLSILFKVSDLHEGVHFKKQVFLLFCFYPREKKQTTQANMFSGASEQSLISKHPPLMGNIQIA